MIEPIKSRGQRLCEAFQAVRPPSGWMDPLVWGDFDEAGQAQYEAAAVAFLADVLPPIETLIMPRNEAGVPADPLLDALAENAAPWNLTNLARALRTVGVPIPTRAEAEMAAGCYFVFYHAVKRPDNWRQSAIDDLQARKAAKP